MMNNFTKTIFTFMLVVSAFAVNAQNANILWTEDFADGIPADWTNVDAADFGGVFTWCNDPTSGQGDGCPAIWDDQNNQQVPFASATANNGFITMDSDLLGQIAGNHISQLTTGLLNFTAAPEVFFSMQSHIGIFSQGLPASDNAILRVSTDNENWTDYTLFPLQVAGVRWSENPDEPVVDISATAAGNMVYLQFQWTGTYEYQWNIDDLVIYDGDPRFENDMAVNNFYALSPNYSYPEGQLENFGFLLDIANVGAQTQTGIQATVDVLEDGADFFTTVIDYEDIPIDSTVENTLLPDEITPTGGAGTVYSATYTVSADAEDEDPSNNTKSFEFVVSDTLFSKAPGVTGVITPVLDDQTDYQWAYGAHYHVVNGLGKYARTMSFSVLGTEENAGTDIFLSLYKYTWDEQDDDDAFRAITPDERGDRIGVTIYTITGEEEISDIITVPLRTIGGDPVELEDNTDYLAMVEVLAQGETQVTLGANRDLDYSAQDLIMDNQDRFRFTQVLGTGNDISLEDYSTFGFAGSITPYAALSIGDTPLTMSNTNDLLSEDNLVVITPNPANSHAILGLDLQDLSQDVEVTIFDAKGSSQAVQSFENIQNAQLSLDVRNLAEGMYFVRVRTDAGVAVRNLVIAK